MIRKLTKTLICLRIQHKRLTPNYKIWVICLTALLLISQHSYAYAAPEVWAESFIVIDSDSGRIIKSKNATKKLPMASTTKIMTSILTIEKVKNLNKLVEIPESCTNIEGSSLYLRPKQKVSMLDLLYGTMLRSGNDAALAVANYAGRNSIDKFVSMMNDKSRELGAYNTNFTNPNGLHDENHYTTAYDLALISQYAMKNSVFKQIASSKSYKATSLDSVLYNKNKVVHQYEYGSGIKIGYTKAAGRCLVASAEKEGTELIVVVLNDNSWFQDSYKLFDWTFENYKKVKLLDKYQYICSTEDGTPLFATEDFSYLMTEEEKESIRFEQHLTIPHIANNQKYVIHGMHNIYMGDQLIYTGELVSSK